MNTPVLVSNNMKRPRTSRVRLLEPLERRVVLHAPVIDAIPTIDVPAGKTLQLPLTASTDHGDSLNWSFTGNSNVSGTFRSSSNTWIEMNVTNFGTMTFQLFDDLAPKTVRHLLGLIRSGFYDNLTFHRVISNFVIQGGDPAGTGSGGPDFRFDDEFNRDASFTYRGQLAMANAGRDTNGSQFFVTAPTTPSLRGLDFNHPIFGQLVRGFSVFDAIRNTPVGAQDRPNTPVVISTVRVIENRLDNVVQLRASNTPGTYSVSVSATDEENATSTRQFNVRVVANTYNQPPILTEPPRAITANAGAPVTINLSAFDPEGDAFELGASWVTNPPNGMNGSLDQVGKSITVTPPANFTGTVVLKVGVRQTGTTARGPYQDQNGNMGSFDTQEVSIAWGENAFTVAAASLQAQPSVAMTNVRVATITDTRSNRTLSQFNSVKINWGDGTVTDGTLNRINATTVEVLGTHTLARTGPRPLTVTVGTTGGFSAEGTATTNVGDAVFVSNGILIINGTSGDDDISFSIVSTNTRVTLNSTNFTFPTASITRALALLGNGNDTLNGAASPVGIDATGGIGDDFILGSIFNDTLAGGDGNDYVFGDAGRDSILGDAGNDTITGGAQADTVRGGTGEDRVNGAGGNDQIFGDEDFDRVYGGSGNDAIDLGSGRNRAWGDDGNDTLIGGNSSDRMWGGIGDDILYGRGGVDGLYGEDGNDTLFGGDGFDFFLGSTGTDSADFDETEDDFRDQVEILI
jgi:cyclophilin family peptidyl-prolyl cis-trans isomerase/Ca2+-binding RTX toxin-like protein